MREILPAEQMTEKALKSVSAFHEAAVNQVKEAVRANPIVVVGMAQNVFVKKARKQLGERGKTYKYLEFGSYFSGWKPRLAIKIWSGWPTFPQVFVDGRLIGGASELNDYLKKNGN